jgi:hypothetical protein
MDGHLPAVGFALLIGEGGIPIRLIFSHVNCGQRWALGLLHPEPAPAVDSTRQGAAAPVQWAT